MSKTCNTCGDEIPAIRVKAMPSATQCVPCLNEQGDVPKLKRFDESGEDGETVSTFFTKNNYIENNIFRINNFPAEDIYYEQAVGDDSFLVREDAKSDNENGYHMSEAFEEEEDEEATNGPVE